MNPIEKLADGQIPDSLIASAVLLTGAIIIMWILEVIDWIAGGRLDRLGIRPRTASGLVGIGLSPFLHGGFRHLTGNTVPLLVLGLLTAMSGYREWIAVSVFVWLGSGLGAWLLGASRSVHIGASGVVFGYLGYLLGAAWLGRDGSSIVIAVIAMALYGGIIWGILPAGKGRSWQAHLSGLISGLVAAHVLDELVGLL